MFRNLMILAAILLTAPCLAAEAYTTLSLQYTGGDYQDATFEYRLMRPLQVEAGKRYPLVVFLHGAGERGDDNSKQLKYLPQLMAQVNRREKFPCFLLAVQCRAGKQWVDVPWGDKQSTPMAEQPTAQLQVALQAIKQTTTNEAVDPDRVYLTGLSMGGYGAWELAAREPRRFAALVPICGGGDEQQAKLLAKLPIWAFHGEADRVVPASRSKSMVEAVRAAGGNVQFTLYPGVGHNSWNRAYQSAELLTWLFQQRRKQ